MEVARNILITLTLKAATRLRAKSLYSDSVLLGISLKSGKSLKDRIKVPLSSDNNTFLEAALKMWDILLTGFKNPSIKKISISLCGLQSEPSQMCFDDLYNQAKQRKQSLSKMIDHINKKLGSNMVTIGNVPKRNKTKSVVAFGHIPDLKKEEEKV